MSNNNPVSIRNESVPVTGRSIHLNVDSMQISSDVGPNGSTHRNEAVSKFEKQAHPPSDRSILRANKDLNLGGTHSPGSSAEATHRVQQLQMAGQRKSANKDGKARRALKATNQ